MKKVIVAAMLALSMSSVAMASGKPFQGPQGPRGPQGEQGVQGPQGEKGEKGDTGATGATGAAGTNGVDGVNGTNGLDGRDGANGLNGKDGAQGADGVDGAQGEQGVAGTNGTNGLNGKDGNDVDARRLVANLENTVEENRELAAAGVASAIAQASIPQAIRNGSSLVGVGAGYFDGEQAIAVGASHRFEGGQWNVKGSVGFTSQGQSAGVGVGYEF